MAVLVGLVPRLFGPLKGFSGIRWRAILRHVGRITRMRFQVSYTANLLDTP